METSHLLPDSRPPTRFLEVITCALCIAVGAQLYARRSWRARNVFMMRHELLLSEPSA